MRILPLKKGNVESIYSTLINWFMKKNGQCRKLVSMGFGGAAMFVENIGVQHD